MNDIKTVISFTYNLLRTTSLTFGNFTFSLFSVLISFACIVIVGWFIGKLFDTV